MKSDKERCQPHRDQVGRLEAGLRDHVTWLLQVNHFLVSYRNGAEEPDSRFISHAKCRFSRWLEREFAAPGRHQTELQEISRLHQELHSRARKCLESRRQRRSVDVAAADELSNCAMAFWKAIRSLQSAIVAEFNSEMALAPEPNLMPPVPPGAQPETGMA